MSVSMFVALIASAAPADEPVDRFAIVIGHNRSSNPENETLFYADDDAFRTYELLRTFIPEEQIHLLAEPDADSLKLFPQLADTAVSPTLARLSHAVQQVAERVHTNGSRSEVYFVYSGHGNVERGRGYLELVDARIGPDELEREVVDRFGDARVHLLIDSCNSYYLLNSRGPGGKRYRVSVPDTDAFFARHPNVGVVLSTSAANEVYEWSELQSGVFSHELRSGLLGPADANTDGSITYRELELFVRTANRNIQNERFRPRVFVRPPQGTDDATLVPIQQMRRIVLPQPGRYVVQDDRGLRVADLNAAKSNVIIGLPGGRDRAYFVRLLEGRQGDGKLREIEVPTSTGTIVLANLVDEANMRPRGAERYVFKRLFESPFPPAVPMPDRGARHQPVAPPASWVHGPTVALGAQSGHLEGLSVVWTALVGYRVAHDRWAVDGALEVGLSPEVRTATLQYSLRRLGVRVGPRYDVPVGPWSISTGPVVGAAWEQQSILDRPDVDATSALWGWRAGVLVLPSDDFQVGLELHGGGRVLSVDNALVNRFVAGAMVVGYFMP